SDIIKTLEEQGALDPQQLKDRFWDMFIVDALIGNWDRHNGNWGFLYDSRTDEISLAPVYDCGSCLFPQADEEIMKRTLEDPAELELRIFERPLSGIKENGQKIQYFKFISSLKNPDCNKALKRIVPRINMNQIYGLIETTPFLWSCKGISTEPCSVREKKESWIFLSKNFANGNAFGSRVVDS